MSVIVLKFGGSSLATSEQIKSVARNIAHLYQSHKKIIVVTSAMGKTTDQLTQLARSISNKPHRREFDMLLTTGERVSMALLAMALNDLNCPAISFTGSQAGIMTDSNFSDAKIIEIKPFRLEDSLSAHKIVTLAGYQGVDPISKDITTLGRGGSDTTAVAMAAHFKAERCEILKDVDGVYRADPQIIPEAQLIKYISIDALYEFCFWGAKVLNFYSVEWAKKHEVPLFIGRSDNFKIGTTVLYKDNSEIKSNQLAESQFFGVNSHKNVLEISVSGTDEIECKSTLSQIFLEKDMTVPQILMYEHKHGVAKITLAIREELMGNCLDALSSSSKTKILRDKISTVTLTYMDGRSKTQVIDSSARELLIQSYFV